jgi:hypothetical protein
MELDKETILSFLRAGRDGQGSRRHRSFPIRWIRIATQGCSSGSG